MSGRVAAFFDLDGTLVPLPSLERRFFRGLRHRREIPLSNYFVWWREFLRLILGGIGAVVHGNKMYLRGVRSFEESGAENQIDSSAHKSGQTGGGQASVPPRRIPRWPVPRFFEDGVERLAWHAMQGHTLVVVSGTLEPLATAAARALETELADRGIVAGIRVRATNLEESEGRWTGRILGEAMFGKAKARAILKLAEEMSLDLSRSWAYGDSAQDRSVLAAVGNPSAVNPAAKLARIASKQGWPVLHWCGERNSTQRHGEHRDKQEGMRAARINETVVESQELRELLRRVERSA
jgi:phosphoserine phosphatase